MTQDTENECSDTGGAAFCLVIALTVAFLAYLPGRSGPYLVDDLSNLGLIGQQGAIDTVDRFVRYLLSGFSGPLGRPIAHASFLLDTQSWPVPASYFTTTNILVHVLNGALLTGATWQLALRLGLAARPAAWVGVAGAAMWLLHPFWVSTTLYVVQRMTLLATTFVFAGLSVFLLGRRLMSGGRLCWGYFCTTCAVLVFAPLAVLSKENGALLPLLLLVVERYVPERPSRTVPGWNAWSMVFLRIPALVIGLYMAWALVPLFQGVAGGRDFTPGERLLSQARILWNYLGMLWIPRPFAGGVFADDIQVSTGLFSPASTALAWIGLFALVYIAERLRKKTPEFSVAIMFYLAGHLLESTWLPLELRFEHRNYLPAALMFFPVAVLLVSLKSLELWLRRGLLVGVCMLLSVQTMLAADHWGRPFGQAINWAKRYPDSVRAQAYLARLWTETGNYVEAERLLKNASLGHPKDMALLGGLVWTRCELGMLDDELLDRLTVAVRTLNPAKGVSVEQVDKVLNYLRSGRCSNLGRAGYAERLIQAGMENSEGRHLISWKILLLQQRALLRLSQGRPEEGFGDLFDAIALQPSMEGVLASAAILGRNGHPGLGLRMLETAPADALSDRGGSLLEHLRRAWQHHTQSHERDAEQLRSTLIGDTELGFEDKSR